MSEMPSTPERQSLAVHKTVEALKAISTVQSLEGMGAKVELAALFESSLDLSDETKVESAARTVERLAEDYEVDDGATAKVRLEARMDLVADAASIVLAGNQSKFTRDQIAELMNKVVKIYPNSHEYRQALGVALAPFVVYRAEYAGVYNDPRLLEDAEWYVKRMKEYELGDSRILSVFKKVLSQSRRELQGK